MFRYRHVVRGSWDFCAAVDGMGSEVDRVPLVGSS